MTRLCRRQLSTLAAFLAERAQEPKGLCTMFLFDGVAHPDVLHVTHKYFGKGSDVSVDAVLTVLRAWFENRPFAPFQVDFSTVEMLGENRDVKVLLPAPGTLSLFLPGLKAHLDLLKTDKWPEYIPHVTVNDNMDRCDYPIVDFVLARGGDILFRASEVKGVTNMSKKMTRLSSAQPSRLVEEGDIRGLWVRFFEDYGFGTIPTYSFQWEENGTTMESKGWPTMEEAQKMAELKAVRSIRPGKMSRLSDEDTEKSRSAREVSEDIRRAGTGEPRVPSPKEKSPEDMKKAPREFLTKK